MSPGTANIDAVPDNRRREFRTCRYSGCRGGEHPGANNADPGRCGFRIFAGVRQPALNLAALLRVVEAVSQTNGIGAKEQRLGEPPETGASGELVRASGGCARLICLDANPCAWCSITNNFRSVTFVKQPCVTNAEEEVM